MSTQTLEKQQIDHSFEQDQQTDHSKDVSEPSAMPQQSSDVKEEELVIPHVSGLETLKEGTFTVDLEKTISDMLLVIKNMEAQLENVLSINASLEKEVDVSKDMIMQLKHEKEKLQATIEQMESQMLSKREMQVLIDHMEEEKNKAHSKIRDLESDNDQMKKENQKLNDMVNSFEEEKLDARMEIDYLEVQLKSNQSRERKYEEKINALRGEKIALAEKMKSLQDELKQLYSDQFKAYQDVKQNRQKQEDNQNG